MTREIKASILKKSMKYFMTRLFHSTENVGKTKDYFLKEDQYSPSTEVMDCCVGTPIASAKSMAADSSN